MAARARRAAAMSLSRGWSSRGTAAEERHHVEQVLGPIAAAFDAEVLVVFDGGGADDGEGESALVGLDVAADQLVGALHGLVGEVGEHRGLVGRGCGRRSRFGGCTRHGYPSSCLPSWRFFDR